jgi:sugar diacid utilization regulator
MEGNGLAARTRERDLLAALAAALVSVETLDEALSCLTRCLLDAAACSEVRIYLYDRRESRLVLRSINGAAPRSESRETVAIGEGPVGRVALSLQTTLVEGQEEPPFTSPTAVAARAVLVAPLCGRSAALVGVVVLQSQQPEVLVQLQALLQPAMMLAAALIERVQDDEAVQRRSAALAQLAREVQAPIRGRSLDTLLERLAGFTRQVLDAERCVVLLFDRSRGMLVLRASSPALPDSSGPAPTLSLNLQMLERLRELSAGGQFAELSAMARARLNPLDHLGDQALVAFPLLGEQGWRGLLYCYYRERLPTAPDLLVLPHIAMQAELGRYDLLDLLTQPYLVKSFFERLLSVADESEELLHAHAALLGMDLSHPFCLVLVEVGADRGEEPGAGALRGEDSQGRASMERVAQRMRELLQEWYPGSLLFEEGTILTCLVDVAQDPSGLQLRDWLVERYLQLSAEYRIRLAIGLSTPCQSVADYGRVVTEAGQALQLGPRISPEGGVVYWPDIRIFSFLTNNYTTPQNLRGRHQEMIQKLVQHDRTHLPRGDRLLETLHALVEEYGNLAQTARRLRIHRNTVDHRMVRIREVSGFDLEHEMQNGTLFDLQLALRVSRIGAPR